MRFEALNSGNVLNTHIIGAESLEKFLRAREGREVSFLRLGQSKSRNFWSSKLVKKVDFGGQNDLKNFFFLNVSEVSGA